MKLLAPAAIALSLALASAAVPAAAIAETASPFRSAEAQAFTQADLQRYGLTAEEAALVEAYQAEGYEIQILTPEEAEAYQAGISTRNFLAIVGLVAIVVVVASAL
ncbi:hypothetical protein [Hyphomonas sp.]|uniref:hypothetical protein n=1 Tax=Hyphomonas sp. TaxID=87 RepID=UPI00391D7B34